MEKAVFLDRDGTLNIDPGYLGDPSGVELYNNVPQVLFDLKNKYGYKLIVISNQSGISRGLITEDDVHAVNNRVNEILFGESGVKIDAFYFCPYHPEFSSEELCKCRKPSPDLVLKAAEEFNIDLSLSYFAGDKSSDILCGINAGTKTILVDYNKTGKEIKTLKKVGKTPNFVAVNFLDVYKFISGDLQEENF